MAMVDVPGWSHESSLEDRGPCSTEILVSDTALVTS